jgi:5-methyltetrahydrofolate--homocysteine methyltransferase
LPKILENRLYGCFYVTTPVWCRWWADELKKDLDDYSIMVKALADRFAEAFAEYLHERKFGVTRMKS